MIIKEFRILLPMTTDEYQVGQLYSVAEASKNETGGGDGIEVVNNEPFEQEKPVEPRMPGYNKGQYTNKIYHISSKVPSVIRALAPKGSLEVKEEAWNCYPYCKTDITNPEYMKDGFYIYIETLHVDNDDGRQENVHNLTKEELDKRVVQVIDIANDKFDPRDYKAEEDPTKFRSEKTGRGPLKPDAKVEGSKKSKSHQAVHTPEWVTHARENNIPVMCAYKLVKVHFKWFGLQSTVESIIIKAEQRIFTKFHRQVFCWLDKWHGMTMDDIRALEDQAKRELDEQRHKGSLKGMSEK